MLAILIVLGLLLVPLGYFFGLFRFLVDKLSLKLETDEDWVIEDLLIHPIKSCRGIFIGESGYSSEGLDYDRRWLIVDAETHKFVTARELPSLVLVTPSIDKASNKLHISFPESVGLDSFDIPLDPTSEDLVAWELASDVTIWKSTTDAYIIPDPLAHSRLSTYLDRPVLLVFKGPTRRPLRLPSDPETLATFPPDARTAFSDGFPILLVNKRSIEDVEQKVILSVENEEETEWSVKPRLEGDIKEKWLAGKGDITRRTRGNVIVGKKGGKPWVEETWGVIQFGQGQEAQKMIVASPCGRCQLPNVDPETGISNPSVPYKTMTRYRRVDPRQKYNPCFGINVVPTVGKGVLKVGDKVKVKSLNNWPRVE
ncbi:Molybdenum cofactor sulfurase [Phaffia rhodozyma]|uniref:MOSC domain containing protein n=1 Tax=Phaffia rhodozyma TaxID=264483 RepID=A0A0F7SHJ9_PHARH|nr:MOSC domain containing protein [Phaffia rhodozyma]CDZ97865.1 Molybdenum cofactor sulfurase [Phaffia rhodozyma]